MLYSVYACITFFQHTGENGGRNDFISANISTTVEGEWNNNNNGKKCLTHFPNGLLNWWKNYSGTHGYAAFMGWYYCNENILSPLCVLDSLRRNLQPHIPVEDSSHA